MFQFDSPKNMFPGGSKANLGKERVKYEYSVVRTD